MQVTSSWFALLLNEARANDNWQANNFHWGPSDWFGAPSFENTEFIWGIRNFRNVRAFTAIKRSACFKNHTEQDRFPRLTKNISKTKNGNIRSADLAHKTMNHLTNTARFSVFVNARRARTDSRRTWQVISRSAFSVSNPLSAKVRGHLNEAPFLIDPTTATKANIEKSLSISEIWSSKRWSITTGWNRGHFIQEFTSNPCE